MKLSSSQRNELDRLVGGMLDQQLSDDDRQQLAELLRGNPAAQDYYYSLLAVHTELLWQHGVAPKVAAPQSSQGSAGMARRSPVTRAPRVGFVTACLNFAKSPIGTAALVLVALAVGGLSIWQFNRTPEVAEVVHAPPRVAQLTRLVGPQWAAGTARVADGDELFQGQRLELTAGLAEIEFDTGARVVLEGPAEFVVAPQSEVGSRKSEPKSNDRSLRNSCSLLSGKLTARVPEAAHGFTVYTPEATIVDRGTEFGVIVKAEVGGRKSEPGERGEQRPASTEVHVFTGKVEASETALHGTALRETVENTAQPAPQELTAGEALRIDARKEKMTRLPANPALFTHRREHMHPILWLDGADLDGDGRVEGAEEAGLIADAVTRWVDKSGHGHDATSISNVRNFKTPRYKVRALPGGSALEFDGSRQGLEIPFDWSKFRGSVPDDYTTFTVFATRHDFTKKRLSSVIWASRPSNEACHAVRVSYGKQIKANHVLIDNYQEPQNKILSDQPVNDGAMHLVTSGVAAGRRVFAVNAAPQRNASSPGALTAPARSMTIGVRVAPGGKFEDSQFVGQVAAIVVFDRALSREERADVESFLAEQWGVRVPPGGDANRGRRLVEGRDS